MLFALLLVSCGGEVSSTTGKAGAGVGAGGAAGSSATAGTSGSSGTSGAGGTAGSGGAAGSGGTAGTAGSGGTGAAGTHTQCLGQVYSAPDWPPWYYEEGCASVPAERCPPNLVCCQDVCTVNCDPDPSSGVCSFLLRCVVPEHCLPGGEVPWLGQ